MSVTFTEPRSTLEQPAKHLVGITPNDSTDLAQHVRGIYVGSAGDLNLVAVGDEDGATQTLVAVPAGMVIPVITKRVMDTGTVASNLVGLW